MFLRRSGGFARSALVPFLLFYLIFFLKKEVTRGTILLAMSCDIYSLPLCYRSVIQIPHLVEKKFDRELQPDQVLHTKTVNQELRPERCSELMCLLSNFYQFFSLRKRLFISRFVNYTSTKVYHIG